MSLPAGFVVTLLLACNGLVASPAEDFRLVQSLSGPSGKVQGSKFVFDESRGRFVYPQDKSFIVYFEWDAPIGTHTLTGLWRRPDGTVNSISPDVKIESGTRQLTCYWTYTLESEMIPGVWTLEVRIDGKPAGSHPFEIAGTAPSVAPPTPAARPKPPSLDQVFRAASPSLVSLHRLEASGKRTETASGFVFGKNRVATALQVVDGASRLQIEFPGGRKVETDEILATSRTGDWAVIAADTGDIAPLQPGDPKAMHIGERQILFNSEGGAKTIGGVDISGMRTVASFGERIQFAPPVSVEAIGGPLLDLNGQVVGILGGSLIPGETFDRNRMTINPALGIALNGVSAATPISDVAVPSPEKTSRLKELVDAGVLTAPLTEMSSLLYVQTSLEMSVRAGDPLPRDVAQFSTGDKQVWVISEWLKKGKVSKGLLSAKVYDDHNHVRVSVEPKKMSLQSTPVRSGFGFAPSGLTPGIYRIDLIWDDLPVWRTFVRIVN